MNETELVFYAIASFAIGYAIAYIFKNIGDLDRRYGIFAIFIIVPLIVLIILAAAITDLHSVTLSLAMAIGFMFRLLKQS